MKTKKTAITFRLSATIHFNRPINEATDYVMPGDYRIVLANGKTIQFGFCHSEIYTSGSSISFEQKDLDYAAFEGLEELTVEDLRSFEKFEEFFIYLGEGEESPGLEVVNVTDASFCVISDENGDPRNWLEISIPNEKLPKEALYSEHD